MSRSTGAGEQVGDDDIEGPVRKLGQYGARVADLDPDPASFAPGLPTAALPQRQPVPHQVHQISVVVDGELRRSGPGGSYVPRQRQGTSAKVQYPQRHAIGPCEVEQVSDPPHVLELQVLRVVEVDVGLWSAADQQGPGVRTIGIGEQLDRVRLAEPADRRRVPILLPPCHDGYSACP
jgi:hypothetical protein